MIEVNLLPPANVLSQKEVVWRRRLLLVVGVVVAFVFLDLAISLGARELLRRQISTLLTRRVDLLSRSEQFATTALQLRTVEEKATGAEVVKKQRADMASMISDVRVLLGTSVLLLNLNVTAAGGVSADAKASDLTALAEFVSRVSDNKSRLTNVLLKSLRQDTNGGFSFQVSATYVKT